MPCSTRRSNFTPRSWRYASCLQPRIAVWICDGDVADRARHSVHGPFGRRRRQVRVLDQGDVVVVHRTATVIAAVEAHLRWVGALRRGVDFTDLLETDGLGPEAMRFLDVAHVQDQMVQADRRGCSIGHFTVSFRLAWGRLVAQCRPDDHAPDRRITLRLPYRGGSDTPCRPRQRLVEACHPLVPARRGNVQRIG